MQHIVRVPAKNPCEKPVEADEIVLNKLNIVRVYVELEQRQEVLDRPPHPADKLKYRIIDDRANEYFENGVVWRVFQLLDQLQHHIAHVNQGQSKRNHAQ